MQKDKIIEILNFIKGKKILIIGDVMLDEYFWGKVERISPEAPVPIVKVEGHSYSLGGAANVALNVCSLEAKPLLIGIIGQDDNARILRSLIKKSGIPIKGLFKEKQRKTILKKRVIAHHQQVVRVDIEDTHPIYKETENRILSFLRDSGKDLSAVIIEDYNKGLLTKNLINSIITFARERDIVITVDPKFEHFFDYENITLFKPNLTELERINGKKFTNDNEIITFLRRLQKRIKAKAILLTMGERGMVLIEKGKKPYYVKPHSLDVFDITGAGDTVISAVTLAIAAGFNLKIASRFASITAAIEVTKLGAAPVSPDEIIQFCD